MLSPVSGQGGVELLMYLPMEASAISPSAQLSFFSYRPDRTRAYPSRPWKQRISQPTRIHCQKMYVAGFGEASPEAKAAKNIHNFFTYIAVRIVTAQLQSYNPEAYEELMEFLSRHSLSDGDKFCSDLMRESSRHKGLALRILEVRSAYCKNDFEWDNLKRLAFKMVDESNTGIMRDYVLETSHSES
ncbi:chaperonin-like RBCX protein 1, chloroplastic [Vitis vinifera]|uniref:Chaperonin-like RBCX protein 1, chloroplastic n=2 Tax=Vitis vinifera TaxID=29760 RepID=E0CVN4_VITVI|eukprot:XP_002264370.3 PREDICTED: chaperonin-like RBCX protein 1, chloroplastic [Vitis vinifera]